VGQPWRRDELDVALLGAGRAIQAVAAVLLMCDPRDLGLVTQVRSPHHEAPTIYLYEAMPGGVGLSERLFARHDELVAGARELIEACGCRSGCPACTGPRLDPDVDGKGLALCLLSALQHGPVAAHGRAHAPAGAEVAADHALLAGPIAAGAIDAA
jgi:DEAD/DEAH box helicase domain-containing protein